MYFDSNLRFEVKADAFYRCTGQLAPGKDSTVFSMSDEERHKLWEDWNNKHSKVIDHILTAVEHLI